MTYPRPLNSTTVHCQHANKKGHRPCFTMQYWLHLVPSENLTTTIVDKANRYNDTSSKEHNLLAGYIIPLCFDSMVTTHQTISTNVIKRRSIPHRCYLSNPKQTSYTSGVSNHNTKHRPCMMCIDVLGLSLPQVALGHVV